MDDILNSVQCDLLFCLGGTLDNKITRGIACKMNIPTKVLNRGDAIDPKTTEGKNIVIVTGYGNYKNIEDVCTSAKSVCFLENRTTEEERLREIESKIKNFILVFGVDLCESYNVWLYFFPGYEVPWFIKLLNRRYLFDRTYLEPSEDLYIFKALQRNLNSPLATEKLFEKKDNIPEYKLQLCEEGKKIMWEISGRIEGCYRRSYRCKFQGYDTICATTFNINHVPEITSRILQTRECHIIAVFWYVRNGSKCNVYLRLGNVGDEINIGNLAKKYGGYGLENSGKFVYYGNVRNIFHF